MRRSGGRNTRNRNLARGLVHQVSFLVFAGLSIALLIFGKVNPDVSDRVQGVLLDGVAPVVDAIGEPVETIRDFGRRVGGLLRGAEQVEELRQENENLRRWRDVALRVNEENNELRLLMGVRDRVDAPMVASRVLSDPGGPFLRAVILDRGAQDGLARHQPVLDETGLVGRIVNVGGTSSRALLVTDFNSRVPVKLLRTGARAVLTGDNSDRPKLSFLPIDADVQPGDVVVTSGDGGVFPRGLSVGIVDDVSDSAVRIRLAANLDRLDFVDVVDYAPFVPPEEAPLATDGDGGDEGDGAGEPNGPDVAPVPPESAAQPSSSAQPARPSNDAEAN